MIQRKPIFATLCMLLAMLTNANAQQASQKTQEDSPEFIKLVDRLIDLGKQMGQTTTPQELLKLSVQQVDLLNRIVPMSRPEEKEGWTRQLAECLCSMAMQSPKDDLRGASQLANLRKEIDQKTPGTSLAAYVGHQHLLVERAALIETAKGDAAKVQKELRQLNAKYVNAYPRAKETTTLLLELANESELLGKDDEALRCYQFMIENKPEGADLERAGSAVRRLELVGKELNLALPLLKEDMSSDQPFDIVQLRGKIVLVCFWSIKSDSSAQAMKALAGMRDKYRSLEVVSVNCDGDFATAFKLTQNRQLPVVNLYLRNGIDGLAAKRLGLTQVPHVIVVGKDGRVINSNAEIATLEKLISGRLNEPVQAASSGPSDTSAKAKH